jgi:hypothetical protein
MTTNDETVFDRMQADVNRWQLYGRIWHPCDGGDPYMADGADADAEIFEDRDEMVRCDDEFEAAMAAAEASDEIIGDPAYMARMATQPPSLPRHWRWVTKEASGRVRGPAMAARMAEQALDVAWTQTLTPEQREIPAEVWGVLDLAAEAMTGPNPPMTAEELMGRLLSATKPEDTEE